MSERVAEFLKKCPSCSNRFVLRVTGRKIVNMEQDMEKILHNVVVLRNTKGGGRCLRAMPWLSNRRFR